MKRSSLVNLGLIQIGWFAAVLGATWGHAWPGLLFAVVAVACYLNRSRQPGPEAQLVALSMSLGFAVDTALVQLELIRFSAPWPSPSVAPVWTVALWMLLATGLTRSMAWLRARPLLAAAVAPVAPFTYWAGVRLGAAELPSGLAGGLAGIGVAWLIALPLLAQATASLIPAATARAGVPQVGSDPGPRGTHTA